MVMHSETSRPRNFPGSLHDWRENIVFNHYPQIWSSLRKLRNESNIARYLTTYPRSPINQPVEDYFSNNDVIDFLSKDLVGIENGLGISI